MGFFMGPIEEQGPRITRDRELEELGRALAEKHRNDVHQVLHVGCGALAIDATQDEIDALVRGT